MNKIKLFVKLNILVLILMGGVFANAPTAAAYGVVPHCNSATFNGYVNPNGNPTTVWFEWGTSTSLGKETTRQTFSVDSDFSQPIGSLNENTTYYYRAMASNNIGASTGETISFRTSSCGSTVRPTVSIRADDTRVDDGDSTTIRWSSNNADSCNASNGQNNWSGLKNTSGSFYTGSLSDDTTFRITCTNNFDSVSDSVIVYVDNSNNNTRLRMTLEADDYDLNNGDSTIIRWDSDDADDCTASNGRNGWSGSKNTSGSFRTGSLYQDTVYRMTCENNNDDVVKSITINVRDNNSNNNNNYVQTSAPTAITTIATNISNSSAQLNSLIFTANTSTNTWFEWGITASLGNSTRSSSVGSANSAVYSDTISGLSPASRYYYRAVAQNNGGTSYGAIMTALTNSITPTTTYVPPTVVQRTVYVNNGVGIKSLVTLSIDGGEEFITPGEKRSYHVEWKNDSNQTLSNVVLRVIFPKTMTFEYTSDGSFSAEDNTLIFNVKSLAPKETGDMFLQAHANNPLTEQELVVITANMVFTDEAGIQNDALAYATHRVGNNGSVLGASAVSAGFLPNSIFGWLLLLILILLVILLAKYLQNDMSRKNSPALEAHH